MKNSQQQQTLTYFNKNAGEWALKAGAKSSDFINGTQQRSNGTLCALSKLKNIRSALDIGCGSGELVCQIARKGIKALGIDFAPEMIEIAQKNAIKQGLKNARFECRSIFDGSLDEKFDFISANGFIEYISYEQFEKFLKIAHASLTRNASLTLESRNRLFNVFSMNQFTQEEVDGGYIQALVEECLMISKTTKLSGLIGKKTLPLQPKAKQHNSTGIGVGTRYQFTPVQLINFLNNNGFSPVEIYPVHVHGVVPAFKAKYSRIHANISNFLEPLGHENRSLLPQSSSMVLHFRKR